MNFLCQRRMNGYTPAVDQGPQEEHPMPQRAATIESLPAAFEVVKAMQAQGPGLGRGLSAACLQKALARDHRDRDGGGGRLLAGGPRCDPAWKIGV